MWPRSIGSYSSVPLFKNSLTQMEKVFLPCVPYHITQTDVQLFSTQTYHHMHGGYSKVHDWQVSIYLTDHWIQIHIDIEQTNLPIFYNYFISENENRLIGPHMRSEWSHTIIYKLNFSGDFGCIHNLRADGLSVNAATLIFS